jgi:Cu+-exporting ATPase
MANTQLDPVCNMQVDEKNAAGRSEYQGQTFYFCSQDCKERFDQNPQQYAKQGAQGAGRSA